MPHPHLTRALQALTLARPAYEEAANFYEGTVNEILASQKLRDLFGDQGRQFRINYARTPVDVLIERTTVQGITCTNGEHLKIIEQAWTDNELGIEAKDVHRRAYEYGDAYLIGWPEADDDPDRLASGVSVYAHDPQGVRVFYDPQQPRRKSHAIHTWLEEGTGEGTEDTPGNGLKVEEVYRRVNLYYPDRVEPWVSKRGQEKSKGSIIVMQADEEFEPYLDPENGDAWPLDNPTPGVIPVFHFRTGRPYGRPEHADAYGPQYAINKLLLSLMGAVDHAVLPQRYVTTDSALNDTSPADAFAEAVGDPVIESTTQQGLDERSTMETGPGNVWLLSGRNVKPGQFAAADSRNFIDPIESLITQLADVTDIPADRYRRSGQSASGESKRFDDVPINNKADDRHAQFGVTWHEVFCYILLVNGVSAELVAQSDAQIAWDPPETYSDQASWETAHLQLKAGIPFDQVMRERGYSSEKIEEWSRTNGAALAALLGDQPDVELSPPPLPSDEVTV